MRKQQNWAVLYIIIGAIVIVAGLLLALWPRCIKRYREKRTEKIKIVLRELNEENENGDGDDEKEEKEEEKEDSNEVVNDILDPDPVSEQIFQMIMLMLMQD